jgi:AcrR family transcriptional regulator
MRMDATLPAKERRRLRTRREIAQAAVELFERNGFAASTTEEIADAADISQSTFFRHFARKEDPIFYDLDERLEAMKADFDDPHHDTAWHTVRDAFVNNATRWETEDPTTLRRVRLFHTEPALIARYLEYCLKWEDAVAELFATERGTDADSDVHVRLIAGAAVTAFRAAFRAQLADPDHGLAHYLSDAFDHLEHGLPD